MSHNKIANYRDKEVYIGIDVHKKTYHITALCDKIVAKKISMPANPYRFTQCLKKWFHGAKIFSAYEASFSGFGLHRVLEKEGIKNIVVNPASIEVAANDRVKTDKRDSLKIAHQLFYGNLKSCCVPTEEQELKRLAQRTRQQFVQKRTRTANQIKSKLFQFSFIKPQNNKIMTDKYLQEIENIDLPPQLRFVINLLANEWRELTIKIKALEKEINDQNKNNKSIERIKSVPGIGPLSANIIYTELHDMSQFSNQNKLFSFLGLTPSEYSSGVKVRKGKITKQGPSRLRHLLIENTWRAITKDKSLREIYERISRSRGGKKAVVACARKLVGRIRACLKNKQTYHFVSC